jgi:hypothetical protein
MFWRVKVKPALLSTGGLHLWPSACTTAGEYLDIFYVEHSLCRERSCVRGQAGGCWQLCLSLCPLSDLQACTSSFAMDHASDDFVGFTSVVLTKEQFHQRLRLTFSLPKPISNIARMWVFFYLWPHSTNLTACGFPTEQQANVGHGLLDRAFPDCQETH